MSATIDTVPNLYQGAVGPEYVEFTIDRTQANVDMATASAVSLHLRKPDKSEVAWVMSIVSSSAQSITARYTLPTGTSVVDQAGAWLAYLEVAFPGGGAVRTDAFVLPVLDRFAVPTPNN